MQEETIGLSLTSLSFFLFFGVVFALYWGVRSNTAQKWIVLLASYLFYGLFDYRFCFLLAAASLIAYGLARWISVTERARQRKALLAAGVLCNLLVLGVFKYFDFFAESAVRLLGSMGATAHWTTLQLILPVGISFYLFKCMSYLVDVYRHQSEPSHDLVDILLYVAFFPQLLSGPIERATTFLPVLRSRRVFDYSLAIEGTRQILWGLFKKVAIADNLAVLVQSLLAEDRSTSGPGVALGMVFFSFQIYCDFSGYTDISIGVSKLLGFRSIRNFAYPYFSQNVAEFWRRWNISVSMWFRDYVYIALGGGRVGRARLAFNIIITFILSGLWHGANLTFLAWGGMLGIGVAFTSLRKKRVSTASETPGSERPTLATIGKMIVCFAFVTASWVFFRSDSLGEAVHVFARMFSVGINYRSAIDPFLSLGIRGYFFSALLLGFIVVEWLQRRRECALEMSTRARALLWGAYTLTFWLTLLLWQPGLPGVFLYYRF